MNDDTRSGKPCGYTENERTLDPPLATLYLDVDGVLSPLPDPERSARHQFRPSPWPDRRGLTFGLRPTKIESEIAVPWSPSLISELDQLRAEFHIRLVWATSWLSGFPSDGIRILTNAIDGLRGGVEPDWPRLEEDREGGARGARSERERRDHPKLRLVLACQETVSETPFIWIDDDGRRDYTDDGTAPGGIFARAKRLTRGTPSLLIAPNRYRGITPHHVVRMREWLESLHDRDQ